VQAGVSRASFEDCGQGTQSRVVEDIARCVAAVEGWVNSIWGMDASHPNPTMRQRRKIGYSTMEEATLYAVMQ
jgi:hypothetical protein